ncbi:MAG: Holliday junction resolvase RuvX [Patescibacteria group bacterium]
MQILGIDYGTAKVGVAIAQSPLAEPLEVIRYKTQEELFTRLKNIIVSHNIEKVVVGESENASAVEAHEFGDKLHTETGLEIVYQDESLSSIEAQALSRQAGIKRSRRKKMEDAYAATLTLQSYLDIVA